MHKTRINTHVCRSEMSGLRIYSGKTFVDYAQNLYNIHVKSDIISKVIKIYKKLFTKAYLYTIMHINKQLMI